MAEVTGPAAWLSRSLSSSQRKRTRTPDDALDASATLTQSTRSASPASVSPRTARLHGRKLRPNVLKLSFFDKEESEGEVAEELARTPTAALEPWHITVGEQKAGSKGNKRPLDGDVILVSVTTPSASLTLHRTTTSVAQLASTLREALEPGQLPAHDLGPLLSPTRSDRSPSKRSVLSVISRSLSPVKQRPPSRAAAEAAQEVSADSLDKLAAYLNGLSRVTLARQQPAWIEFFAASGSEDTAVARGRQEEVAPSRPGTANTSTDISDSELPSPMDIDHASSSSHSAYHKSLRVEAPRPPHLSKALPLPPGQAGRPHSEALSISPAPLLAPTSTPEPPQARSSSSDVLIPGAFSTASTRTSIEDFDILRVLGKGCAGKVLLVRHKSERKTYALKSLVKKHVLEHRELHHTMSEQAILANLSSLPQSDGERHGHPFIAHLQWSFRDESNLYLCLDFYPGGDLATQLARWGILGRDRARFYACEIVAGLEALHKAGVIYRDLKPENVLIAADGHIVLTDFGLSKLLAPGEAQDTTTFCGTAEYLAPEVLLGARYSYAVDWYSFGTMLYEMLFGKTPFYVDNHREMYRRIVEPTERLVFPDNASSSPYFTDEPTRNFIRGLLNRDPIFRIGDKRVRNQPYFAMIRWEFVDNRRYKPPFVPDLDPDNDADLSHFDKCYLDMKPSLSRSEQSTTNREAEDEEDTPPLPAQLPFDEHGNDVFDGYSFRSPDAESLQEREETEGDVEAVAYGGMVLSSSKRSLTPSIEAESEEEEDTTQQSETGRSSSAEPASTQGTSVDGEPRRRSIILEPVVEHEVREERRSSEDDWDVVEDSHSLVEMPNGSRAGPKSFFARGIVDKYRMQLASNNRSRTDSPLKRAGSLLRRGTSIDLSRQNSRPSSSRSSTDGESPTTQLSGSGMLPKALRRPALIERTASAIGFQALRTKRSRHSTTESSSRSASHSRAPSGTASPVNTPPLQSPLLETAGMEALLSKSRELPEVVEEPGELSREEEQGMSGRDTVREALAKRLSRTVQLLSSPTRRTANE